MKKILALALTFKMAVAILAICTLSGCEKEYEPGEFTMYIYGVGEEGVTYDVHVTANYHGYESAEQWKNRFNNSRQGLGTCGNLPEDISGKIGNNSKVFTLIGLNAACGYSCNVIMHKPGSADKTFFIPIGGNWNQDAVWINVSLFSDIEFEK